MTCFHPIPAFYPVEPDEQGKRYLKFGRNRYIEGCKSGDYVWMSGHYNDLFSKGSKYFDAPYDFPIYLGKNYEINGFNIKVPCGKCIGCRLDYSRMWATRSANEAYSHGYDNCAFLTLTFNDDMLARRSNPFSLNRTAFQSWIKRLRKAVKSEYNKEFRIMACGEYGAKHHRPHYHMIVYGFNFPDSKVWKYRRVHGKDVLYKRSEFLEKVWSPAHSNESYGFSVIGDVNFESSAYVARYVTKKLFGKYAEKVYKDKEQEFLTTSRMPGLGYGYLVQFYKQIFDLGYIMLGNGHKVPIPRYYINKLQEIDEEKYNEYSIVNWNKRIDNLFKKDLNSTQERLLVREELKKMNVDRLIREYEAESLQNDF